MISKSNPVKKLASSAPINPKGPELVSVCPVNNLLLSENNKPIAMHPSVSKDSGLIPIAFRIGQQGETQFEVELSSLPESSHDLFLQGLSSTGVILFSGTIGAKPNVCVKGTIAPSGFSKLLDQSLHWQINRASGETILLGKTMMELYWVGINDFALSMFRKGTSIEGLRSMAERDPKAQFPTFSKDGTLIVNAASPAQVFSDAFNYIPPAMISGMVPPILSVGMAGTI